MKPSAKCYKLIKEFEGCNLHAYKDPGSEDGLPITIGWGSTTRQDGTRFKLGETISQATAEELLKWKVEQVASKVTTMFLNTTLSQGMFDALVSFAYNVGTGALMTSTLRRMIILNPYDLFIPDQFTRWNKNGGKTLAGLTKRRAAEAELYIS